MFSVAAEDWQLVPDGKNVAVAGKYGRVVVFNPDSKAIRYEHTRPKKPNQEKPLPVNCVQFSEDSNTFVSSCDDRKIILHDVTIKKQRILQEDTDCTKRVRFSSDGKLLAASGNNRRVYLWSVSKGGSPRFLTHWEGHLDTICSMSFSPDGRLIAVGGKNGQLHVFDAKTGKSRFSQTVNSGFVRNVQFCDQGKRIATSGFDSYIKFWQVR